MQKQYRNGPVGALIDEYERTIGELKFIIANINRRVFTEITDNNNSVQSILNHVISSAYIYADLIRNAYNKPVYGAKNFNTSDNPDNYIHLLEHIVTDTINSFDNYENISDEELSSKIIITPWGQKYDIEQLLEHAIVHVLRHRRQIEKLLKNTSKTKSDQSP